MSAPVTVRAAVGTETFEYLPAADGAVYCVTHTPAEMPRAAVLLCGPIGAERERAYRTLVDLARALAARACAVTRFDYRGIGESSGAFEARTLDDWSADLAASAARLRAAAAGVPVMLWGLRMGALLAADAFRSGVGDSLMLLAPMAGAQDMMQDILRRKLMADMMAEPNAPRTTREEIVERLGRGETYNVDGYFWSGPLWEGAARLALVLPPAADPRPWCVVDFAGLPKTKLDPAAEMNRVALRADRFWEASPRLVPASPEVAELTLARVESMVSRGS